MALVKCRECGKEVSTGAKTCPHCGIKAPAPRTTNWPLLIAVSVLTVVAVAFCQGRGDEREQQKRAALERAAKAEQERRAAMTAEARAAEDKAVAERKAAEKAAAAAKEADFQRVIAVVRAVKSGMNDPSSFEIDSALVTAEGAIGITYRGKNSFGALVLNYAVMTKDRKLAVGSQREIAPLWNRHIAGKSSTDLTASIRGAKTLGAY